LLSFECAGPAIPERDAVAAFGHEEDDPDYVFAAWVCWRMFCDRNHFGLQSRLSSLVIQQGSTLFPRAWAFVFIECNFLSIVRLLNPSATISRMINFGMPCLFPKVIGKLKGTLRAACYPSLKYETSIRESEYESGSLVGSMNSGVCECYKLPVAGCPCMCLCIVIWRLQDLEVMFTVVLWCVLCSQWTHVLIKTHQEDAACCKLEADWVFVVPAPSCYWTSCSERPSPLAILS